MEIQNKIGEQVFDKLRSKFKHITLGDEEGNSTQSPSDAVFFNFNYIDNEGHDHGNITISLIDGSMKIYYSKNISTDLKGSELTDWYAFLQDMRKTAMSNLYRFDTHDISKSALDIADIQATVARNDMNESLQEGKMYGSTKSSYQECGPAKIIVRHNQRIDPEVRGSRSRKVESIFVETDEGERFKMPFNSVPGARAMARHVGNGGRPHDDIGQSIVVMVEEIASLRPFIARNRNAIYEDETTIEMVEAAKEYYNEARNTLNKIKGARGYKAYAESFEVTETVALEEDDLVELKDRFTKKRFSEKMEAAMPIVKKAYSLKHSPKKPVKPKRPLEEFEDWAESITEMPEETVTEEEEMCPEACCGKPVSQCKCGPDCIHCNCYSKNHPEEAGKEHVEEVKAGEFKSPMVGRQVTVRGADSYDKDFDGQTGTVVRAEREHTFSSMRPFVVVYTVEFDDGSRGYYRREAVKPAKQPVTEGTWAIPDTPEKMTQLRELLSGELKFGPNGENATSAMYSLFGDDELFDAIYAGFELLGPEEDAVPFIKDWIETNAPEFAKGLTEGLMLEDEGLTDDITSMLINRIARYVPEVFTRHGPEHVYNVVRDNVAWLTDDWPEGEGFGSSDSYGAWKSTMRDLGIDEEEYRARVDQHMQGLAGPAEVPESRGRKPHERMKGGDVVLPKADYGDYLEVYKTSAIGGTDVDDDAERMVKALQKQGKNASIGAAKGALKRMAEQEAKTGLHMEESLAQLMRDAGITK